MAVYRIGLDARTLTAERPRGTGRNLLDAYRHVSALRPEWKFHLYHQRPLSPPVRAAHPEVWERNNVVMREIELRGDRLDAWFQLRLPMAAWWDRLDLLHFPANLAPAWCPVPFVLTVHDLVPLLRPEELSPEARRAFHRGLQRGIRRAAHVVTPSVATRDDLCREFDVPPERVSVVPWAADARLAKEFSLGVPSLRVQALRDAYQLSQRWLLSFGGGTPRKNAAGTIAAFARLPAELRTNLNLVLLGCEPEPVRQRLEALAHELGVARQVRTLGFVPHAELPAFFSGAAALVIASFCEGFGLPVLDAFAAGVPVVASSSSSLPEVAGAAAEFCDPDEPANIAVAIRRALEPARTAELVAAGHARSSLFTWEQTAAALCMVYEHCLLGAAPSAPTTASATAEGAP